MHYGILEHFQSETTGEHPEDLAVTAGSGIGDFDGQNDGTCEAPVSLVGRIETVNTDHGFHVHAQFIEGCDHGLAPLSHGLFVVARRRLALEHSNLPLLHRPKPRRIRSQNLITEHERSTRITEFELGVSQDDPAVLSVLAGSVENSQTAQLCLPTVLGEHFLIRQVLVMGLLSALVVGVKIALGSLAPSCKPGGELMATNHAIRFLVCGPARASEIAAGLRIPLAACPVSGPRARRFCNSGNPRRSEGKYWSMSRPKAWRWCGRLPSTFAWISHMMVMAVSTAPLSEISDPRTKSKMLMRLLATRSKSPSWAGSE